MRSTFKLLGSPIYSFFLVIIRKYILSFITKQKLIIENKNILITFINKSGGNLDKKFNYKDKY